MLVLLLLQTAEFIAGARAGTASYRDPQVARAAGYRPVGPDFPGMGRHWIHPALILRDTLDPAAPPILEYAEIEGRPTLVGVAYAKLVHDATPPAGLPVPAAAWHFHQGTVEEESFLRSHAGLVHGAPARTREPRIAVLHAWIWLENPGGLLATDNWALPYARLGYRMPAGASHDAGHAVALAGGGTPGEPTWRRYCAPSAGLVQRSNRRSRDLWSGIRPLRGHSCRGMPRRWRTAGRSCWRTCGPPCGRRCGSAYRRCTSRALTRWPSARRRSATAASPCPANAARRR